MNEYHSLRVLLLVLTAAILAGALVVDHMIRRCAAQDAAFLINPWGCQPNPSIHLDRGIRRA
jgi:hypothetical protein